MIYKVIQINERYKEMSAKTSKLITPERVERILECYGSNPDCWPEDEKTAALSLIQHSAQLLKIQQEAEAFDELLVAGEEVAQTPAKGLLESFVLTSEGDVG